MFHRFRSLLSIFVDSAIVRPFFSLNMQHLSCIASHIKFLIFSGAFEHTSTQLKPLVKSRSKLSPLRWYWRRARFVFQNSPSQWSVIAFPTLDRWIRRRFWFRYCGRFLPQITFNCSYAFGRKNQNWNHNRSEKWKRYFPKAEPHFETHPKCEESVVQSQFCRKMAGTQMVWMVTFEY